MSRMRGAELLVIFVSPRIGEAMPLESVRYISLSYIPEHFLLLCLPPHTHTHTHPSSPAPLTNRPVFTPEGSFVFQAQNPQKNSDFQIQMWQ